MWDVTAVTGNNNGAFGISTHTSRVGCDQKYIDPYPALNISTHTSRVGCDSITMTEKITDNISTHTSRVGCDNKITVSYIFLFAFLLTHPVWDVTLVRLLLLY